MSCTYSKEILALYIEDDLPTADAVKRVGTHVATCARCRDYCEQLQKTQSFIKLRFKPDSQPPVSQEMLVDVRRRVMSRIDAVQESLGWAVKVERFLMIGLRRHRYALAGLAVAAIVSVSLMGQIQRVTPHTEHAAAVFVGNNTLLSPVGYREWVFAGSSLGLSDVEDDSSEMYHNVYINPAAYHEYVRSGKFPDGTVMVLEMLSAEGKQEPGLRGSYQKDLMALEVSVKDSSRFDGGWGFYNFTESAGRLKAEAEALPQTASCLSCHRDKAATDHVFTQFYPVLRGIGS